MSKFTDRVKEFFVNTADDQEPTNRPADIMTEEEKETGDYFRQEYMMRMGEMGEDIAEWDDLAKAYRVERDRVSNDPSYPCSKIAVLTPAVEGQVASMTEAGIEFNCRSRSPNMEPYLKMLDAAGEYIREINMFVANFKDFSRNYDVYGNAIVEVSWEKSLYKSKTNPDGYPHISIPDIRDIIIDGKIEDYKNLQHAEYIIHRKGVHSIAWAKDKYGEEKASAISTGPLNLYGGGDADNYDRRTAFMLLHVWTRRNKYNNLQLIEMTEDGFVLKMSDPKKPYYTKTLNQYPFYMSRMIPQLGSIYGIGDGRMLAEVQDVVNKLTDELTIAAKFSAQAKWAIDPRGKAKLSQINSDPSKPFLIENPNTNVRVIQAAGVNAVVFNYIQFLLEQSQRMTRYHDIMTGNIQGSSATATQINAQISQGNVGINDKKSDIAAAMAWAYRYCLQLCLQYWNMPMWSRVENGHEWVDMDFVKEVPVVRPASPETVEKFEKADRTPPKYENVRKGGKKIMQDLEFDVRVIIGQGIPKGRIDIFNMIVNMLQVPVGQNPDGTTRTLISETRAKEMLEEVLGFALTSPSEAENRSFINNTIIGALNPATEGGVQPPAGSQVGSIPNNLAATVPGVGSADKRGML